MVVTRAGGRGKWEVSFHGHGVLFFQGERGWRLVAQLREWIYFSWTVHLHMFKVVNCMFYHNFFLVKEAGLKEEESVSSWVWLWELRFLRWTVGSQFCSCSAKRAWGCPGVGGPLPPSFSKELLLRSSATKNTGGPVFKALCFHFGGWRFDYLIGEVVDAHDRAKKRLSKA